VPTLYCLSYRKAFLCNRIPGGHGIKATLLITVSVNWLAPPYLWESVVETAFYSARAGQVMKRADR